MRRGRLLVNVDGVFARAGGCGRQRVNEFGDHDQVPPEHKYRARVVRRAAVVCRREQGDQVAMREPLEPIHHALVRADNHLEFVVVAELHHTVGSKRNQPGPTWGWLHPGLLVIGGGVGPQQVHQDEAALLQCERPLEFLDLLHAVDASADT